MPFALIGYTYALTSTNATFEWSTLLKVILCMVFARNAAMGFNRWVDRDIDALNPRTVNREIPSGVVSPRGALTFVIINSILFIATAFLMNNLTGWLSPVALFVVLFYSICKRFTWAAHLWLGIALSIAPMGAYAAVCAELSSTVTILSGVVMCWCAGFDIIYAMQDREFDMGCGLHSIPSRFTIRGAKVFSITLHIVAGALLILFASKIGGGAVKWAGVALFEVVLFAQHIVAKRNINIAFATLNSIASIFLAIAVIFDLLAGN